MTGREPMTEPTKASAEAKAQEQAEILMQALPSSW
jgi:hypothetical protein